MVHSPILVVNDTNSVMNTIEWYIMASIKYSVAKNGYYDIRNEITNNHVLNVVP